MYLELDLTLTDEQRALREHTHRFAAEVLRPAAAELDAEDADSVIAPGSVLFDVFAKWYSQGNHTAGLPLELGGADLGPLDHHIIYEELGWGGGDLAVSLGVTTFPFTYAARFGALMGNTELVEEIVRPFAEDREGKIIGCWAITEPAHGSDTLAVTLDSFNEPAAAGACRASQDGTDWIISGQKSAWVSNGTIATHACLFVTIDASKGMAGGGVAIVPLDLPGVSRGKPWHKMGQRALAQGEIFFDDVRIPERFMLVGPELYPMVLDMTLATANAGMGAIFTGVARAAFEEALEQVKTRVQGGRPIAQHQLVQDRIFRMFAKVEQARALSRSVMVYNGTAMPPSVEYSIASKVTSTQAAFDVANDAIQLFGAMGLSKEVLIEKIFRDARAALIEDGVNDLLGLVGANHVLQRYQP